MSSTFTGSYPIETRHGEIERLELQGAAMAPDTMRMLELIGVDEGWACLDIGCGPGGITGLLSRKAGPAGRVVGLDMNDAFLAYARATAAGNTTFLRADAFNTGLPAGSFDLAHMRFLASTCAQPERLLREAIRVVRPGGTIALQEADVSTLNCFPPHPSWDRLKNVLFDAFKGVGADVELARRLYHDVCATGLVDVQFRPFIVGVRAGDPMADYLPSTIESIAPTILKLGLMTEAELPVVLGECRRHLRQAGTSFTLYTVAQVWGRKQA